MANVESGKGPGGPGAGVFSGQSGGRQEESASGTLGAMKEKAGELAAEVAGRTEDAWSRAPGTGSRDEAREWAGAAATRAEDAAASAAQFIRRHPWPTLLALFGLGFFLGGALRRLTEAGRGGSWRI